MKTDEYSGKTHLDVLKLWLNIYRTIQCIGLGQIHQSTPLDKFNKIITLGIGDYYIMIPRLGKILTCPRFRMVSHHEEHPGSWQNCKKCKDEFETENYVDYGTNDSNFEKLANPPKISIKCANCSFQSDSVQDFSFQTSKGWYCDKEKCQEAAMKF